MLKGFEQQTEILNEYEQNELLPVVILGLTYKVGKENAVTNSHICRCLKKQGYLIDGARLRKIINHIRVKNLVIGLMATSNGYYIAESKNELVDYISSLKGRENAIKAVRVAMENQMNVMY
jgi:hypothetical protein